MNLKTAEKSLFRFPYQRTYPGELEFRLWYEGYAGNWMLSQWLVNSGYEWGNRESFERCYGERFINGKHFFDVDICVPVKVT